MDGSLTRMSLRHRVSTCFPRYDAARWLSASIHNDTVENEEQGTSEPLILTDRAAQRLTELSAAKKEDLMLRVAVEGGGCGGFSYVITTVTNGIQPDDVVLELNGKKVVVDEVSYPLIKGSKVDFVEDLIQSTFLVLENPQAGPGCGCGNSFEPKM